ncbi:hypothetical protein V1224_06965 [Lachnospiraceae bacterium JLR.KK008]
MEKGQRVKLDTHGERMGQNIVEGWQGCDNIKIHTGEIENKQIHSGYTEEDNSAVFSVLVEQTGEEEENGDQGKKGIYKT